MYESVGFGTILIVAGVIGLIPAAIASNKGHSFFAWWLFGAALFIVALPMAIVLRSNRPDTTANEASQMKKCPFCAEMIQREAIVCRFCGRDLPNATQSPARQPQEPKIVLGSRRDSREPLPERNDSGKGKCNWVAAVMIPLVVVLVIVGIVRHEPGPQRPPGAGTTESTAQEHAAPAMYVYAKTAANVRLGPSTTYEVVRRTQAGEQLAYDARQGSWYRLCSSGESSESWIHESVVLTQSEKNYMDRCPLRLDDWHWSKNSSSYVAAEGQVTNMSSRSLEHVEAVVTFKTETGEFITSESALIEFDPLLPGQTSPWRVLATWNPRMSKAHVEFKHLLGGRIETYRS